MPFFQVFWMPVFSVTTEAQLTVGTSFPTGAVRVKSIPLGLLSLSLLQAHLPGAGEKELALCLLLTPLAANSGKMFLSGANDIPCLHKSKLLPAVIQTMTKSKQKYHCHLKKKKKLSLLLPGTQLFILGRQNGKPQLPCEVCVSE